MKKLNTSSILNIAICIGVILWLAVTAAIWLRVTHLQKMCDAAISAHANASHAAETAVEKLAAEKETLRRHEMAQQEMKLRLGIVHRHEGIETAFIRQLIADPSICDATKVCRPFPGNRNNAAELKQWAGPTAHILACKVGYADCKYGPVDIFVVTPDTISYVIQKTADGIRVVEYRVNVPSPASSSIGGGKLITSATSPIIRLAAPTIAASQFLGLPDVVNKLPSYEYRHICLLSVR
jgi:hypothetical protein